MSAQLMDGKALAEEVLTECAARAARLKARGIQPKLAVIRVGEDPASVVYVQGKIADCRKAGLDSSLLVLPPTMSESELLEKIAQCNADPSIHGLLVQLPLPSGINERAVINAISADKDADGFHPINVGRLLQGDMSQTIVACTPAGVLAMLKKTGVPLFGKNAVVVGRSNIVGKPMAQLLLQADCTVTMAHSRTINLPDILARADIVVAAVGRAEMIRGEWLAAHAIVVDVGMNRNAEGKLCGDVHFASARERVAWISPVPGGVGPMTRAMLLANTLTLAERHAH